MHFVWLLWGGGGKLFLHMRILVGVQAYVRRWRHLFITYFCKLGLAGCGGFQPVWLLGSIHAVVLTISTKPKLGYWHMAMAAASHGGRKLCKLHLCLCVGDRWDLLACDILILPVSHFHFIRMLCCILTENRTMAYIVSFDCKCRSIVSRNSDQLLKHEAGFFAPPFWM